MPSVTSLYRWSPIIYHPYSLSYQVLFCFLGILGHRHLFWDYPFSYLVWTHQLLIFIFQKFYQLCNRTVQVQIHFFNFRNHDRIYVFWSSRTNILSGKWKLQSHLFFSNTFSNTLLISHFILNSFNQLASQLKSTWLDWLLILDIYFAINILQIHC